MTSMTQERRTSLPLPLLPSLPSLPLIRLGFPCLHSPPVPASSPTPTHPPTPIFHARPPYTETGGLRLTHICVVYIYIYVGGAMHVLISGATMSPPPCHLLKDTDHTLPTAHKSTLTHYMYTGPGLHVSARFQITTTLQPWACLRGWPKGSGAGTL